MDTNEVASNTSIPSIATDYYALREEGIHLLQQMSGNNWTDYNVHDPGITILEQLCYALTDLAYRIGHPIPDLLTDVDGKALAPDLYPARSIMTTAPVTLDDFRKILLDTKGVRNAWVEKAAFTPPLFVPSNRGLRFVGVGEKSDDNKPVMGIALKGLLTVKIEPEIEEIAQQQNVLKAVTSKMMAARSLCNDFFEIELMQPQPIAIKAEIEAGEVADATALLIEIFVQLDKFISPRIRFYSLQEMLDKGYTTDEIIEGPALENGYVDPKELRAFSKKEFLRGSDLIRVISDIAGVRFVRSLEMALYDKNGREIQRDAWSVRLNPLQYCRLIVPADGSGSIQLKRGAFNLATPGFYSRWQQHLDAQKAALPKPKNLDNLPPSGRYRAAGAYQSIQNYFPVIYGIGEGGVIESTPGEVKGRVNQLKAYLLFFDQLLANAFAQLEGFKTSMSFNNSGNKSRFSQLPLDVADLDKLLPADPDEQEHILRQTDVVVNGTGENKQLHRVADHLLARLGEQVFDYSLLLKDSNVNNQSLNQKKTLLEHYPYLGQQRATGINYTQRNNNINISALQKRIAILLAIDDVAENEERFWLVENLLLRPLGADKNQYQRETLPGNRTEVPVPYYIASPTDTDIFSLQLSFVFAAWPERFSNINFRIYAEDLIRKHTPAHITFSVYWMEENAFKIFEQDLQHWHLQMQLHGQLLTYQAAKNHSLLTVRLARNKIIDSLAAAGATFGYAYPVLDLPVQGPYRVMEGDEVNVTIELSQPGVSYRLWDRNNKTFSGNAVTGNGTTITLISEPQKVIDNRAALVTVWFDVQVNADKTLPLEFWLQSTIAVVVTQLSLNLDIQVVQNNEVVQTGEIAFNSAFAIRILKPQKGVEYTVYSALLEDADFTYSGHGQNLKYSINPLRLTSGANLFTEEQNLKAITLEAGIETLDIPVPAKKNVFEGDVAIRLGARFKAENRHAEFLDKMVSVFLSPDAATKATIEDRPARVEIAKPENGTLYTLFIKDERLAAIGYLPQKNLASANKNANTNPRVEVDFVIPTYTSTSQLPLQFKLPPNVKAEDITIKAQKLNTKVESVLRLQSSNSN